MFIQLCLIILIEYNDKFLLINPRTDILYLSSNLFRMIFI